MCSSTIIANEQHVLRKVLDLENRCWILKHNNGRSHGLDPVCIYFDISDGAKLGAGIDHSLTSGMQFQRDNFN